MSASRRIESAKPARPRHPRRAPPPSSRTMLLGAAVVGLAALLRFWSVGQGLPSFVDEAIPFRRALAMWDSFTGEIRWDPRFFHYPSLSIYVHLALQQLELAIGRALGIWAGAPDYRLAYLTDPAPMVLLARAASIAFDLASVVGVILIGERLRRGAGWLAGLALAFMPTMLLTARGIYVDTVLAAASVGAIERTLAWLGRGGRWRLAASVALIGLAAGAKYPGAMLLLPLGFALWRREGTKGLLKLPGCALGAGLVFLATTPYALLDRPIFRRDFQFVRAMAAEGHFGNFDRAGFAFHLRNLGHDLGWPAVAMLAISPLVAILLRRAREGSAGGVLGLALLVYGVPISLARVEAERYLAPILPFAALLAADTVLALAERAPARARAGARVAAALAIALPPILVGIPAAGSIVDGTRFEARAWLERHVPTDRLLLQEVDGAPILERMQRLEIARSRMFAAASPGLQRSYLSQPWLAAVTIPLVVVGGVEYPVMGRDGHVVQIPIAANAAELNRAAYDPRLFAGADYVVTSAAVRGRNEAEPSRYATADAFYALLDSTAEVAARFEPRGGEGGPRLIVYRLTPRTHAALERWGPLPPLWWLDAVSPDYREQAERVLLPPEARGHQPPIGPDGEPAVWVKSLRNLFDVRFAEFAQIMSFELIEKGELDQARRFAASILLMSPADVAACLTFATASEHLGEWPVARAAIERTLAAFEPGEEVPGLLRREHATVLQHLGEREAARAEWERLAAGPEPDLAEQARRALDELR